jgi:hypothetical protein
MPYRIGIALCYAVREGAVARDEAMRNARPDAATSVGMGGMGLEAVYAVAVSPARPGVEGMKAATTKTTSGMKATAAVETAATTTAETAATTTAETAATTTAETAATTAVETAATTAPATARLRCVCERHDCAREDRSERQPNLFAAPSSQHTFLTLTNGGWEGRQRHRLLE